MTTHYPFPSLSAADKAAHETASFTATFRYIGTAPPRPVEGTYLMRCRGYDGTMHEIEHGLEEFEVTDPRVAKCLDLMIDFFTKEHTYLRVS